MAGRSTAVRAGPFQENRHSGKPNDDPVTGKGVIHQWTEKVNIDVDNLKNSNSVRSPGCAATLF